MIKKFFKKFVCDIIYLIVNFIIKLPIFKKFQLVEINASRVANLIMETEIFYRESNSNKVYLIFFYKISNKYFVQLFLEKIKRNKKIIVLPGYFFWKKVCNAFYFSSIGDLNSVKVLSDYVIERHYEKLKFKENKYTLLL